LLIPSAKEDTNPSTGGRISGSPPPPDRGSPAPPAEPGGDGDSSRRGNQVWGLLARCGARASPAGMQPTARWGCNRGRGEADLGEEPQEERREEEEGRGGFGE